MTPEPSSPGVAGNNGGTKPGYTPIIENISAGLMGLANTFIKISLSFGLGISPSITCSVDKISAGLNSQHVN
jgi:hypothetical protein